MNNVVNEVLDDLTVRIDDFLETVCCGVKFLGDIILGKCDTDQMKSAIFGSLTNNTEKVVIALNP